MTTSDLFIQSFFLSSQNDSLNKNKSRRTPKVTRLYQFNKEQDGVDFLKPLDFYKNILEQTDDVLISYMSAKKRVILLYDLQNACLFLVAQRRYEQNHQKTENEAQYLFQIKKCQYLIDALKDRQKNSAPLPVNANGYTKPFIEDMRRSNKKRLYWVWGSAGIKTGMDLLPADFYNVEQAKKIIQYPDPYTGFISWALYYFRFGLYLGLLLKHVIPHPWMSKEEQDEAWLKRFAIQWDLRKFNLLNDSVWATVNLLCYFWLYGKGLAGVWGDFITVGLLMFDVSLAVWDYLEQKNLYVTETAALHLALDKIIEERSTWALLAKERGLSKLEQKTSNELEMQQGTLERVLNKYEKEWRYQNLSLVAGVIYALGLTLAFLLATLPFFPATLPLLPMTVTGTFLCFALTVIANGIKGAIEIYKASVTMHEEQQECEEKLRQFSALTTEDEKRDLFLEVKLLMVEIDYQEQKKNAETMVLIQSIALQLLVPTVIFSSLVFLPSGLGLAALVVGLGLMSGVNQVIHNKAACERKEISAFDGADYGSFSSNPVSYYKKGPVFFSAKNSEPKIDTCSALLQCL